MSFNLNSCDFNFRLSQQVSFIILFNSVNIFIFSNLLIQVHLNFSNCSSCLKLKFVYSVEMHGLMMRVINYKRALICQYFHLLQFANPSSFEFLSRPDLGHQFKHVQTSNSQAHRSQRGSREGKKERVYSLWAARVMTLLRTNFSKRDHLN